MEILNSIYEIQVLVEEMQKVTKVMKKERSISEFAS
jgi:hypothetical protein